MRYLADRGFDRPVVIGHRNGGMLGAHLAAHHPEVGALVLLSAHAGGPHPFHRSCEAGWLAGEDADDWVRRARELVAESRGDELPLLPGWWFVITANSLLDRVEHTPDLLECAAAIRCPSLFLCGDRESSTTYPAEDFARRAAGPSEARILTDATIGTSATRRRLPITSSSGSMTYWPQRTLILSDCLPSAWCPATPCRTRCPAAGFDDILTTRDVTPQLSTLRLPMEEMGATAMALALKPAAGARVRHVRSEVVLRGSTGPPPSGERV